MNKIWLCLLFILYNDSDTVGSVEYSNEWLAEILASPDQIDDLVKRHGFEFISTVKENVYILRHRPSPARTRARAEGTRKSIMKEPQVKYMEQQKWNKRVLRSATPNDPFWSQMWYLNGKTSPDMGVTTAWSNGYTGQGVTIGIVDDGVDVKHPDLKSNVNSGLSYDFYARDNDPTPSPGDPHGTECAGVAAAASNNSICVSGAAYNAKLAGLRLLGAAGSTNTAEHDALLQAGVDIFSNSWGIGDGDQFDGPSPLVKSALKQGTQKGRNGLGSIYVWAAGNGGIDDNCNCDGFVNSIHTIAISSVAKTLQPPGYAEPCAAIMASAFSGAGGSSNKICTTSLNNTCVTTFSGTSAATPMAAAIFALALQANPRLTWRDLQHLIVNTSDMSGLVYAKEKVNGAGHTVSDYFGFGLLKSGLLTERAEVWETVREQHTCTLQSGSVNKKIFSKHLSRVVSSSVKTDGCNDSVSEIQELEHVEIEVNYKFTLRGAVKLKLTSPSGTESELLTRRNVDYKANSQQKWTFMSVQFWDEKPVGTWTLKMLLDSDYGEAGELLDWTLRMYGTTTRDIEEDEGTNDLLILQIVIPVVIGGVLIIAAAALAALCFKGICITECSDAGNESDGNANVSSSCVLTCCVIRVNSDIHGCCCNQLVCSKVFCICRVRCGKDNSAGENKERGENVDTNSNHKDVVRNARYNTNG